MKRFLIQIAVFFAMVAVIDVCCGFGFDYLKSHAKGGDTYKNYYIAEKCEDDVLILGSSRSARHYVPSIIEDSLGLTCYNAGEPGCGIVPAYARYKMVAERHKPKLVIYEVTPDYDYFVSDDYSKYLGRVRQYTDKESVLELYSSFGGKFESIKAWSNMYRNNSCIVSNLLDQASNPDIKGYKPLSGVLSATAIEKSNKENKEQVVDSLKLSYVEKLIQATKEDNVPMAFVISPSFNPMSPYINKQYSAAIQLAQKYNICFLNCADMEDINGKRELFQDFEHLNDKGATLYTKKMIGILKDSGLITMN